MNLTLLKKKNLLLGWTEKRNGGPTGQCEAPDKGAQIADVNHR